MNTKSARCAAVILSRALTGVPALAQTVKVTPLGGIDGEFCPQDRALIFEDPNGTRILYDPGRTVRGASDPRLGKIDIILLSHVMATTSATRNKPRRTRAPATSRTCRCRPCRTRTP